MKKCAYIMLIFIWMHLGIGCGLLAGSGQLVSSNDDPKEYGDAVQVEDPEMLRVKEDALWSDPDSMKAIIVSDLHYTEYKEVDPLLVPGIAVAEEITEAIVKEVIGRHPDVLILTGDNTNSGYLKDVEGLTEKLEKVREAGIEIIITTGNHDFDMMDAREFENAYFGLVDPIDRDPHSLSYTAVVKDVVFLAMDDNAVEPGGQGEFSEETMQWIGKMLDKYRDSRIIFLSHHNVLYGYGEEETSSHLIQNPDLPELLRKGGVKLAMSGHMHFQYVTEKDGLWEIVSGMPFSGRHLIGNLAVGNDRVVYFAGPVDFAEYGSFVKEELDRLDLASAEYMEKVFAEILDREGIRGTKKKSVLKLIIQFMQFHGEGTIAEHAQELSGSPFYEMMIEALWNYNYGAWMKAMVEDTLWSSRRLELSW